MFFDSLQLVGGAASADMPVMSGPRQVGQLPAENAAEVNKTEIKTTRCEIDFFIGFPFHLTLFV